MILLIKICSGLQKNAQKVQTRLMNPRSPAHRAADVVEHVIATGGEDYLETRQSSLYWWQLALFDVKLVLGLGVVVVVATLGFVVWLVYAAVRSAVTSVSSKKTQVQKRHKQL